MAAMRRDGKALAAIAEAWGVSRMVVVGIAHRNPELFPARERKKKEASKPAAVQRKAKAAKLLARCKKKPVPAENAPIRKQVPIEAYDTQHMQLPGAPTVAFVDCGEFHCRLVLTRGGEQLGPDTPCCGRPVAEGSAYCPEHHKLMYRPREKRAPAW